MTVFDTRVTKLMTNNFKVTYTILATWRRGLSTAVVIFSCNWLLGLGSKIPYPVSNTIRKYPVSAVSIQQNTINFGLYLHLIISFREHSVSLLTLQSSSFDFWWHWLSDSDSEEKVNIQSDHQCKWTDS